jgi:hydrogenase nickel incorporation protein HypA/HybF
MHELSMAQAVVATVGRELPGRQVSSVQLRIGVLSSVVPQALAFAWDVVTPGTALAGSTLRIDSVPAVGRCHSCGFEESFDRQPPWRCRTCDGISVPQPGADLLEIGEVELADSVAGPVIHSAAEPTTPVTAPTNPTAAEVAR